jgi:hypothetical protein
MLARPAMPDLLGTEQELADHFDILLNLDNLSYK